MTERAILGGGCFWCLEAVFERLRGVLSVTSGYCGGTADEASYHAVCSGNTGHAEVVAVDFDPQQISFEVLLKVFFTIHDPTTLNRQGNDIGPQYRSVIFALTEEQRQAAIQLVEALMAAGWWERPALTEIVSEAPFYPAEEYHQQYYRNNPGQGYCAFIVAPKVAKARAEFAALFRD